MLAFVGGCTDCIGFKTGLNLPFPPQAGIGFPLLGAPGLPNFLLGAFGAAFAGINIILGIFEGDLPKPPTLSIFIEPFTAALAFDFEFPPDIDFKLVSPNLSPLGFALAIPVAGFLAIFKVVLFMIFGAFKFILDLILDGKAPKFPSFKFLLDLFTKFAILLAIPVATIALFGECLVKVFLELIKTFLPF